METKLRSVAFFDVGADIPHKALTAATDAALAAARERLAGMGSVDAVGALGSASEGVRRVRVDLTLRAPAAPAAMEAEKAFAEAFVSRLVAQGYDAARA